MRIVAPFLLLLTISLSLFTSCKKYTEGPGLSLRSPEARLEGDWIVLKATEADGDDATDLFDNFTFTFTKEGGYSYRFEQGNFSYSANGSYILNDEQLTVTSSYDFAGQTITDTETVEILRLTQDELIVLTEDGDRIEYQRPA